MSLISSDASDVGVASPAFAVGNEVVGVTGAGADDGVVLGGVVMGAAAEVGVEVGGETVVLHPEVMAKPAAVPPATTNATTTPPPIIVPRRRPVASLLKYETMMLPLPLNSQSGRTM